MRLVLGFAVAALAGALITPHPASARIQSNDVSCTVGEVAVYYNRVHIFCSGPAVTDISDGAGGIRFFALAISDPMAAHAVTIASAALVSGRPISLTYAPGASNNPEGCAAHDCRKIANVRGYGG
jgi:hypothetical protein